MVLVFGQTDIGAVRNNNQDVFCIKEFSDNAAVAFVCDGMGGENGGQIASAIASQVILDRIQNGFSAAMTDEQYKKLIINAFSHGNIAVFDKAQENIEYKGMGTTGVLALIVGDRAYIAHVGDSRLYMLRDDELYQITKDHSIVQTLVEQGKITPEEALTHPQKNMITRAIGVSRFVDIDYIEISNVENSALLLCSDGLTNMCSDEIIKKVLLMQKPADVCETLIHLANNAGGIDNITTVYMVRKDGRIIE